MKNSLILFVFSLSLVLIGCNNKSEQEVQAEKTLEMIQKQVNESLSEYDSQLNKARQTEGKTYLGTILRAEQAFYLNNDRFTSDISELGILIDGNNYKIEVTEVDSEKVIAKATSIQNDLPTYYGAASTSFDTAICESKKPVVTSSDISCK